MCSQMPPSLAQLLLLICQIMLPHIANVNITDTNRLDILKAHIEMGAWTPPQGLYFFYTFIPLLTHLPLLRNGIKILHLEETMYWI
jgi:hypothetical protein